MKKITSIILVITMLVSLGSIVNAKTEKYLLEKEVAIAFLNSFGYSVKLTDPIPLLNLKEEEEFVCFEIDKQGYIIVNQYDLSIPELSIKSSRNFKDSKASYYYNGGLNLYKDNGTYLLNISNNEKISRKEIKNIYTKEKSIDKERKSKEIIEKYNTLALSTDDSKTDSALPSDYTIELPRTLKTWYVSGGYCGPIAAAIVLMYYDEEYNESYVSYSNENESDLIDLMIDYVYSSGGNPENGTGTAELENAINDYLDDYYNSNYAVAYAPSYDYPQGSFSKIGNCIANDKPAIVDLDNHPTYGEHWVIAHGYTYSPDQYVIVNDGWENNNIWLHYEEGIDDVIYLWSPQ